MALLSKLSLTGAKRTLRRMSSTTRERIVDEAMRLFGEHGYRGTTITTIEAAAGLTPGAGAIYHHFKSKDAILTAGIERHLDRLTALRDVRRVLTPLGDLRAELTLTARYILAELDHEAELLKILASEARNRPQLLEDATQQLITASFTGFAAWIIEKTDDSVNAEQAAAIAQIGLGSLFSSRLLTYVLGTPAPVDDEQLVSTWVEIMTSAINP